MATLGIYNGQFSLNFFKMNIIVYSKNYHIVVWGIEYMVLKCTWQLQNKGQGVVKSHMLEWNQKYTDMAVYSNKYEFLCMLGLVRVCVYIYISPTSAH